MHSAPPHTAQTLPASATTRRSSGTCGRCSAGTSASTTPSRRPPAQPGAHAVPVQLAPRRRPAKPGIDTTRRPGLSVKLASWHSDVSQPGRGNLKLVLGSHLVNWIDGPRGATSTGPTPKGAIEVTTRPGTRCSSTGGSGPPAPATTHPTRARPCSSATPTGGPPSTTETLGISEGDTTWVIPCFGGRHTEQMLDGIASVAPPHTALKWSAIGTAPVDDEDS